MLHRAHNIFAIFPLSDEERRSYGTKKKLWHTEVKWNREKKTKIGRIKNVLQKKSNSDSEGNRKKCTPRPPLKKKCDGSRAQRNWMHDEKKMKKIIIKWNYILCTYTQITFWPLERGVKNSMCWSFVVSLCFNITTILGQMVIWPVYIQCSYHLLVFTKLKSFFLRWTWWGEVQ